MNQELYCIFTTKMLLDSKQLHPGFSIDCVIFGFHNNELKVLLLKFKKMEKWALPGGFLGINEDVDIAASHVLKERTGLDHIFLTQFYLFGNVDRNDAVHDQEVIDSTIIAPDLIDFFKQRFITLGYYSLVEYSKVVPVADVLSDSCEWFSLDKVPKLIMDHQLIIDKALWTLRTQLKYQPIGINLLPEKFTMSELQSLYETLLGIKLDRRNFQRKMLGYGIMYKLEERRTGGAHKPPFLYAFNKVKYDQALSDGLYSIW